MPMLAVDAELASASRHRLGELLEQALGDA